MLRTLIIGTLGLAASCATADVLYETEDPFGGFLGLWGMDVSSSQTVGARFTPDIDATLDQVSLWFMDNSGGAAPSVRVTLRESDPSDDRFPGETVLETWDFRVSAVGWNPQTEILVSVVGTPLVAGRPYWIVAESNAPGGQDGVWNFASEGVGFSANTFQGAWQAGGSGAALTMTVEGTPVTGCVADWNNDGTVNVSDLLAYLALWFAADLAADLDESGTVGIEDLLAFLGGYFVGCP